MSALSLSLWLPIGRADFYSGTAKGWLDSSVTGNVMRCSSRMLREPDYIPHLQASVLRRLLEVLSKSLGYDPVGTSSLSQEMDGLGRPVDVTMTLEPRHGELARAGSDRWSANGRRSAVHCGPIRRRSGAAAPGRASAPRSHRG